MFVAITFYIFSKVDHGLSGAMSPFQNKNQTKLEAYVCLRSGMSADLKKVPSAAEYPYSRTGLPRAQAGAPQARQGQNIREFFCGSPGPPPVAVLLLLKKFTYRLLFFFPTPLPN